MLFPRLLRDIAARLTRRGRDARGIAPERAVIEADEIERTPLTQADFEFDKGSPHKRANRRRGEPSC